MINKTSAIITVMHMHQSNNKKKFVHSCNRKTFYKSLSAVQKRRRRNSLPSRAALLHPMQSPFRKVLQSNNDQALITLTGFDVPTFQWLLSKFQPLFDTYTPQSDTGYIKLKKDTGCSRNVDAAHILGLCLTWTGTHGSCFVLQGLFGMSMTNLNLYLKFGRRLLVTILLNEPDAKIKIPSLQKIDEYKAATG